MRITKLVSVAAGGLLLAGLAPVVAAETTPPCTSAMPAGDWAKYGGPDGMGTNRQDLETTINSANVGSLVEDWRVATSFQSEPIVSGNCVFITNGGGVEARRLDDGSLVWHSDVPGSFAVTVADGRVHVNWGDAGEAFAAALDVSTGDQIWTTYPDGGISFDYRTGQSASAVVHEGIQVLFTTGPDFDPKARPGYALFDAATGSLLHKQTTITEADLDAGYAGGGVWGTPTVDPVDDYLYAATANPYSEDREHAYDNAVLKIDLDRSRPTFGTIVGSYKGDPDNLVDYDNPVCQNDAIPHANVLGSRKCMQTDVDFGNGPTLWRDPDTGDLMLAILQKTGFVHTVNAETMEGEWKKEVGSNSLLMATSGNLSRIATDGETLYVVANHAFLRALDNETGDEKWMAPVPEGGAGGNVAYANGVVYHVTQSPTALGPMAWDAATGEVRWTGYLPGQGPHGTFGPPASGVAIAGNRVVVNAAGGLAVFELPEA